MKKYLIRVIGALCILGAVALMFMGSWVEVDGIRSKDLRALREDTLGIIESLSEGFMDSLSDSDFKDDLKDNDLPYTRSTVKDQFKDLSGLAKELLDETISLKELLVLSWKGPGVIKDVDHMLDLEAAEDVFCTIAQYIMFYSSDPVSMDDVTWEDVEYVAATIEDQTAEVVEGAMDFRMVLYGLVALLIIIGLLGVVGAVTHVCNHGRWVKYMFMIILVALAVGSMIAMPMVNEVLEEALYGTPTLEDLTLKVKFTPILAVALMFVPIVLDIIFERKKTQTKMEA